MATPEPTPAVATEPATVPVQERERGESNVDSSSINVASKKDSLNKSIQNRPDVAEVEEKIRARLPGRRMSANISRAAGELEKAIRKDALSEAISLRPDHTEVIKDGVIKAPGHVSNKLHAGIAALGRSIARDKLGQQLETRPNVSELQFVDDRVAPRLQATQRKLSRALASNKILHRLESRPDIAELIARNIVRVAPQSDRILANAEELQKRMKLDALSRLLETRPAYGELVTQGLVRHDDIEMSDRLHGPMHELNKNILKGALRYMIENRPTQEQLAATNPKLFKSVAPPPYNPSTAAFLLSPVFKPSSSSRSLLRTRYALAFKVASRLTATGQITKEERGVLKELILDHDQRVFAAIEVFEIDEDVSELLDTIYRITKNAVETAN